MSPTASNISTAEWRSPIHRRQRDLRLRWRVRTPSYLASKNAYWPNGIGNDNGLVGAFLVANPYIYCNGEMAQNPKRWQQELSFPTLCSRAFDTPTQQASGKFLMNMANDAPWLQPGKMIYEGESAQAVSAAATGTVNYLLQGGMSAFGYRENTVALAPGTTRFGLPRTAFNTPTPIVPQQGIDDSIAQMKRILAAMNFTVTTSGSYPQRGDHAASTCRMSATPEAGVVDTTLRVWDTNNVYVASNAAIPAIGAANITLTLVAMIMKAISQVSSQAQLPKS